MNGGPGGFAYAPVTKAILLSSAGASILSQAARASHRPLPSPFTAAAQLLVFKTPSELLFGSMLLYYFRVFERQWGSKKYGAYALAVTGLSYALQLSLGRLAALSSGTAGGAASSGAMPSGPMPIIFASFVPFLLSVPPTSSFSLLGLSMTDKAFVYMAGAQLLFTSGRRSLLLGGCALLAGLAWHTNLLGCKQFRLPAPLARFISSVFRPLLADGRSGATIVMAGHGAAMAAAGAQHGRPGGPRPQQPAAGQGAGPGLPFRPNPEALESLVAMGFDRARATSALRQSNNDLQAAISLLL